MKRVTLWSCDRCGLQFVADDPPKICPACRNNHSGAVTIRLAGRDVEVSSVRLFGDNPLKDHSVTKGLDSLRLGARCHHGYIYAGICPECN
jgi:hypothetical protein